MAIIRELYAAKLNANLALLMDRSEGGLIDANSVVWFCLRRYDHISNKILCDH